MTPPRTLRDRIMAELDWWQNVAKVTPTCTQMGQRLGVSKQAVRKELDAMARDGLVLHDIGKHGDWRRAG